MVSKKIKKKTKVTIIIVSKKIKILRIIIMQ